jgi:hypothetical protein
MKPQFLTLLPNELQAAVQKVEELAGCEINVVRDAAANEFDNLTMGIINGDCFATIACRGESISRCALIHEMLHLQRYWLDAVPRLRSTRRGNYEFDAQWIDELIEHLIIIPQERRFAKAESDAHWSSVMEKLAISTPASHADVDLHRSLLVQRAMLDIALADLDHARVYERLRGANLLDASADFVYRLRKVLHSKQQALAVAVQALGYDVAGFCVSRFDLQTDRKSVEYSPLLNQSP